MSKVYDEAKKALDSIRDRIPFVPEVALTLGSGLSVLAEQADIVESISYEEIDGLPKSTVPGHAGKLLFAKLGGKNVLFMQGRWHFYEGYSTQEVTRYVRMISLLGVKKLFLTNAAGGIGDTLRPGDIMLITDHISQFVPSPLLGENAEEFGPRFPDMTQVYSMKLRELGYECAKELDMNLKEGVYLQFTGPSYETPAEIRMAKMLGADAVGMSTAIEAMVARHCGLEVVGASLITNKAAGLGGEELSHEEVTRVANESKDVFAAWVAKMIEKM